MSEKHIGKVIQVTGPVLDIRFPEGELPALLNAIEIDNHGEKLIVEVAQQTGDHMVRCIAMKSIDGLVRGKAADKTYFFNQSSCSKRSHWMRRVHCTKTF